MNKPMRPPRSSLVWLEENTILGLSCLGLGVVAWLVAAAMPAVSPDPTPAVSLATAGKSSALATAFAEDTIKPAVPPVASASDEEMAKDAWLNALTGLEFTPIDQAAPEILKALQGTDREVRLRAVNLLIMSKDNAAILPLLAVAQGDADAEVRRDAIGALENSGLKTDLTPYLVRGAADGDEGVRSALVETVWSLSPDQRDEFIGQTVNSSREDVASAAFEMLKHEYSTNTVKLLLNVYATNNVADIKKANDVMNSLLNQTFANATEAGVWWQQHQGDYQDDLSLKTADGSSNL
jgi:hypothetical protein